MTTDIRINHLVLDGLDLSRRERDALGPAIARELRRLSGEPVNRSPHGRSGPAVDEIARQVAAAVHLTTAAVRPPIGSAARPRTQRRRR